MITQSKISQKILWIEVCKNAPYFQDETGESWTPIGQNDAVTWPEFKNLYRRKDMAAVDEHMAYLAAHGVTCLRMMMEYCQTENRYLEKPVGKFQRYMVQFWDDLFLLCEKHKFRLLITPFDTFWMARRWKYHPYNKLSGGVCRSKWQWLSSADMMSAIKNRFSFFIERWGASGAIFGWDLWNEISPVHAAKNMDQMARFVEEISAHIRELELRLFNRTHLQTVSVFAPTLKRFEMNDLIFKHPQLDFATTHFYDNGSMDFPRNTYSAAIATGNLIEEALANTADSRPFFDSEHGPITYFRRKRHGLEDAFDEAYFLNIQWAHLVSGGAGGGMRWPYRHPHVLTYGMRMAQQNLSDFVKLVDWKNFQRKNLNESIRVLNSDHLFQIFGCGDKQQAVIWILSLEKNNVSSEGQLKQIRLKIPDLTQGRFIVYFWNTKVGLLKTEALTHQGMNLTINVSLRDNLALAVIKV